jgi:hypothetical protein
MRSPDRPVVRRLLGLAICVLTAASAIGLAACSEQEPPQVPFSGRPISCTGTYVISCTDSDVFWLQVVGMKPGTDFTWTIDGHPNIIVVAADGAVPNIAIQAPVEAAVSGTLHDGSSYADTITVGQG